MNSKPYILVVEDSKDIRDLVGRLYSSEGYDVILAGDGKEALEKLRVRQDLPAFILLDLMMPGMDGFQFCIEQEKDPRLKSVPVVVMTADANAKDKADKMGAKGWVRKPADIDVLLALAEKYCCAG